MKKIIWMTLLVFVLGCSVSFAVNTGLKPQATKNASVQSMNITGEIAFMDPNYIIRGKKPAEIFTILNPVPGFLDVIIKRGQDVDILVHIVSGDNVEILEIDGKNYPNK